MTGQSVSVSATNRGYIGKNIRQIAISAHLCYWRAPHWPPHDARRMRYCAASAALNGSLPGLLVTWTFIVSSLSARHHDDR